MTYKLAFVPSAQKEWQKLDNSIKQQFKQKLMERLEQPRVPSASLSGLPDCYKIKLRHLGYRLVYQVQDDVVTLLVVAVGKRDKSMVYRHALLRLDGIPK